ncbi:unnamed protein product [Rhizoctonia solani]|uniref:Endonuclease 3 n=1 Tax=Rhizoctonia solani TaxID=456999 RepID=A0A8H3BKX7_9AGAM|nr:unnamed protein product [Rhizoctonia solani]
MRPVNLAISAAVLAVPVWSWGDEGHKITATIAQIHLLPSAREAVCSILKQDSATCNLAHVATWPDEIKKDEETRKQWSWSFNLHFVNGIEDNPPEDCSFGTKGWTSPNNILAATVNMTHNIQPSSKVDRDTSLRFLTHFLGDIHQPFHGTGRFKGANTVLVRYDDSETNLHSVWDDFLIQKRIKLLTNYTTPLSMSPDPARPASALTLYERIELALDGSNYDPLVRWIVVEGIYGWWATEHPNWTICPQYKGNDQSNQQVLGIETPPFQDPTDLPLCPYYWTVPTHQMLCGFIWRPDFKGADETTNTELIQLNTTKYTGRIQEEKLVEKQLALGGMRLAGILNAVLGSEEEKLEFGILPQFVGF